MTSYLIHDPASGPVDFKGPRCVILFESSAFHKPDNFGVSARLHASALFFVSSRLGVTHHQGTNIHTHPCPVHQIQISPLSNMQSVHREWVVNRDHCSPKRPRHSQKQSSDTTGARRSTEERCVRLARWLCRKVACQTIYVPGTKVTNRQTTINARY
jgi:hypothetical protein